MAWQTVILYNVERSPQVMIRIVSGFFFLLHFVPDLLLLYVQKYGAGGNSQFFMEHLLGSLRLGWIQQTVSALIELTTLWGHGGVSALGGNIQVVLEQIRRGSGVRAQGEFMGR